MIQTRRVPLVAVEMRRALRWSMRQPMGDRRVPDLHAGYDNLARAYLLFENAT